MSQSFLARLPLARSGVDPDHLGRQTADSLVELESSRFLVLSDGRAMLSAAGALALVASPPQDSRLVYLGRALPRDPTEPAGSAFFAAIVPRSIVDTVGEPNARWATLRECASTLSDRDSGLFVQALAMANWHASAGYSPHTGAPTTSTKGGWVLLDSSTNRELFPRTDTAVIVGVLDDDDRLLLGSNAQWESNRYSLLAGFVEPGESFEAAIVREVFEESGLRVVDPVYLGSQPWPFPASLMVGFFARVHPEVPGSLTPDGEEILDLRWFSRAELYAARDEIRLPGDASIARAIIEEWYGGALDVPPTTEPAAVTP